MLPGLLTETLCSLISDIDRMAFSVIWEIDSTTMQTISTKFGKSVIRSRASLNYYKA